jgi:protein associated with RNAse G/E
LLAGERVQVRAYKADGRCYRWWYATVEAAGADELVLVTPAGHRVEDVSGGWFSRYSIRAYYWPRRWYSLMEVYLPDGKLVEIYININSPVEIEEGQVRFTDYELDVSREPPDPARIVDEDEFQAAAARYGYSEALQQACYRVAGEALEVASRWQARGMPSVEA